MSEGLFSTVELGEAGGGRAGYRLDHIEVFNWGTFDRQVWRLTPGAETSLLTGDIGSGKSTIVDALTTLLMPAHRISYNKAAGAESKERTLRSYVEGHYKSERIEASGRSRAIGLRTGAKTYSVVLGVFTNEGFDETVTLAQVFQQREQSGQPYRFYVTAAKALSIADDFAEFGTDLKDLRKRLRAGGAEVVDEFPKYSSAFRRHLGIHSEQALELFHQTVSMKSVGNLNEFVRDHMLEPSDASERVREIIGHFDDLTKAHDAVKRAREQLEALAPIVATTEKYDAAAAERDDLEHQRGAVRIFVAELRAALLASEISAIDVEAAQLIGEQDEAKELQGRLSDEREDLIAERERAGGTRIADLERIAREARAVAKERGERRARFEMAVDAAGLAKVADSSAFAALSARVVSEKPRLADRKRELDASVADLIGNTKEIDKARSEVGAELASLERRTSNLPGEQVELRAQLCADLGLTPEDLPYAGELLDVSEDFGEWRGAAERVLRGFALSLLVPQEHYDTVTGWVNGRRLTFHGRGGQQVGAKLVYERVASRRMPLQRHGSTALLLADCMEAKEGPFREYLLDELTKRADFRCAETLAEFRDERRAVTREGQVRSGDRHEKDDRHRVDDPRRWVLGWANERKIAALRGELADLEGALALAEQTLADESEVRDKHQARIEAFARLDGYHAWTDLDVAEAEQRASAADDERARLEAGSSRLEEIKQALERNAKRASMTSETIEDLTKRLARMQGDKDRAARALSEDEDLVGSQPSVNLVAARATYDALRRSLGKSVPARSSECGRAGERLTDDLHKRIDRVNHQLSRFSQILGQDMNEVLRRWPELRTEMDASVDARGDFVALHVRVAGDDLPRFEDEFKRQLNTNTIRELAQFNSWLRRQAEEIDDRVARINEALSAIPYNPGRYIRLEKQPTVNQDVAAFRSDLRSATDDAISGADDHYSEQRFLDVKRIIERFRGREGYADSDKAWTRRVTDVRNWFVFSASERVAETDEEWEHYSDSDGKSGGQKEKLAYTILAASLAYQFGLEWGVEKSRDFRFAVIDEAFGRGSDVSTRYALSLFAKLGLQLLIVTPLQKVHVIEPYVSAIGFVDNPTGTASRLQTMTIEEYRERRDGHVR
jgi:uncharacterized protein YPO0396